MSGIHRIPVFSYFEVQLDFIGAAAAHFGNELARPDVFALLHQNFTVVRICAQEMLIMIDDYKVTVTQ